MFVKKATGENLKLFGKLSLKFLLDLLPKKIIKN